MNKKVKTGIIAIILLFIAGMIAYPKIKRELKASREEKVNTLSMRKGKSKQILNINAEVLKYQSLIDKTIVTGSTIPDEEVNLSFESSGKIVDIFFKEGSHVKRGELLAKINDKPLQAQLRKLEAQVPLAKDRVYRQHTLLEKDAVSQEAYEQVVTSLEILMADIALVKAHIEQTELRAPFDGIVGLRNVSEGSFASVNTVVTKLTKIKPLKIEFSIPEKYSSDIKEGTKIIFKMITSSGLEKEYQAKVYAVESKIDEETRSLKVRATYPNLNEAIIPGRYTSIEITRSEIMNALAIPNEAVIPEMGKDIVYLYKGGKAQPKEIEIGIRTESHVQVLKGIEVGDTLITSGVMQLRTGINVKIDKLK